MISRSISEALAGIRGILDLTRAIYDTRVEFTAAAYTEYRAAALTALSQIIEDRERLKRVMSSADLTPIVASGASSRRVAGSSLKLPIGFHEINAISDVSHLSLSPSPRVYAFQYNGSPITGSSVVRGPALESSHRFSLKPEKSDYAEQGLFVDWDAMEIAVADEVACVNLDNTRAARLSGLLSTLSGVPLAYWSTAEVADAFAAEISVTQYEATLVLSSGAILEGSVADGDLVTIDGGKYVAEAGELRTYVASKPASDLDGAYRATATSTEMELSGEYTFIEEDTSQRYDDLLIEVNGVKPGDAVFNGLTEVGVVANGGVQSVASVSETFTGGDVDVYAETYTQLSDLIGALDSLITLDLPTSLVRRDEFISAAAHCEDVISNLSSVGRAVEEVSCPDDVRRVWYTLRGAHLRAGLDRAVDLLTRADLATYKSLSDSDSSYSNLLADLADDLIVKVQQ